MLPQVKKSSLFTMRRIINLPLSTQTQVRIDPAADFIYVTNQGAATFFCAPGYATDSGKEFHMLSASQVKFPVRGSDVFTLRTIAALPQLTVVQHSRNFDYMYGRRIMTSQLELLDDDRETVFDLMTVVMAPNSTRIITFDTKPDYYYITRVAGTVNVNLGTSADPVNFFTMGINAPILKIPATQQSIALSVAAGTNTVVIAAITKDVDYAYGV
jgi:hypothetical protein